MADLGSTLPVPITSRQETLLKRTFIDYKLASEFLKQPLIFERAGGLYVSDAEGKR